MQATYGDQWPERVLLGVYHITFSILSTQGITNQVPPGVMDGLDALYNVVEGIYGDGD